MQPLPHRYLVAAAATEGGDVQLSAASLPRFGSAPPAEFGGPGDLWSPETLLVAALGDCLVLTFRGVARASRVAWTSIRCEVTGTLSRVENVTQFTGFDMHVFLVVPDAASESAARRAVERAERTCLIANSLKAPVHLVIDVGIARRALAGSRSTIPDLIGLSRLAAEYFPRHRAVVSSI